MNGYSSNDPADGSHIDERVIWLHKALVVT